MQNWNDLIYCLALSEHRTMNAAAKALRTNPTTVSRRISRLSEGYDRPLFVKDGSEWRPTKLGQRLINVAAKVKVDMEEVTAPAASQMATTIRIYASLHVQQSTLITSWAEFIRQYPKTNLHVTMEKASLGFGEVDLTMTLSEPKEGRIVRRRIGSIDYAVYGDIAYEGQYEGWIEVSETEEPRRLDQSYLKDRFGSDPRLVLPGFNVARQTMRYSPLLSYLPKQLAAKTRGLKEVEEATSMTLPVWIAYHETRRADPVLRQIIDWIANDLK